jgi:ferredoxin
MTDQDSFTVTLRASGRSFSCPRDSFVLDAALAAGVKMAFSCRQGMCSTCKSQLASGQVDMKHQGGIRPKEIAAGKFLPCCSRPLSDLVVEA